jgi:hypothetical protein
MFCQEVENSLTRMEKVAEETYFKVVAGRKGLDLKFQGLLSELLSGSVHFFHSMLPSICW